MAEKIGTLFVVSGPSGVGKGTVIKELMQKDPMLCLSISMTSRLRRSNEVDGKDYFFVSESEFLDQIEKDNLLEWAKVHGNYYGTPKDYVLKKLNENNDVILEIDTRGASKIKSLYPDAILIFIVPPRWCDLRSRLETRSSENFEEIQRRLSRSIEEIEEYFIYEYIIVNNSIIEAASELECVIVSQRAKRAKREDIISRLRSEIQFGQEVK
ncbi:guanylate kinase [Thermodesulfobium sp. 4217-1]|uniref:guanylate kinase n=1 Tax=Thermodesulfobium sp. 4217-1 TaxID=3120013 RepID=UPI00322188DF